MNTLDPLATLQDELRSITARVLSPRARYLHVLLLLVAAAMGLLCIALLLTEPVLPMRTQIAFGVMSAIAAAWVLYSTWVLRHRQPLMASHRVVASRMAVVFSTVFLIGSSAMLAIDGKPLYVAALSMALGMLLVACGMLIRARRKTAQLLARCRELEQSLARAV